MPYQKPKHKNFMTSPSQHAQFDRCKRQWWLERVWKLPLQKASTYSQGFGTVLHAVVERWLRADETGRDAEGNTVELYPEGWHEYRNKFTDELEGEITPEDQALCKKLVEKAIEEGVIQRLPRREMEREFRRTLINLANGTEVKIMGFIDVSFPDAVHDHKTAKTKRYILSPDKLREATPMLAYAKDTIDRAREAGRPVPKHITLRHNYFIKNPPQIKKVECVVTVDEINKEWERLQENAVEMDRLRQEVKNWYDIEDPADISAACNAYGGCPYRSICQKRETIEGYEKRLDRILNPKYDDPKPIEAPMQQSFLSRRSDMSFAAKLAARKAIQEAAGAAPTPALNPEPPAEDETGPVEVASNEVAPAPAPSPEAEAPTEKATNSPPWAKPDCPACEGDGFNSKGNPCRICDLDAAKNDRVTSADFRLGVDKDGNHTWTPKDEAPAEAVEGSTPTKASQEPVESKEAVETAPKPKDTPAPKAPETPDTDASEDDDGDEGFSLKGDKGRPARSFTLCLNCSPISGFGRKGGGRGVFLMHEVLEKVHEVMAADNGVDSAMELDVFQRRDKITALGREIAAEFGKDTVVVEGLGTGASDLRTLVDAVKPYAERIIVPIQ